MIQARNEFNQYYFALDSTFLEAKLTETEARTRPNAWCQGQLVEAEDSRPKVGLESLTSLPSTGLSVLYSINQSIKTHLYCAVCRKRIGGARWAGLGRVFTFAVRSIKQFSFQSTLETT